MSGGTVIDVLVVVSVAIDIYRGGRVLPEGEVGGVYGVATCTRYPVGVPIDGAVQLKVTLEVASCTGVNKSLPLTLGLRTGEISGVIADIGAAVDCPIVACNVCVESVPGTGTSIVEYWQVLNFRNHSAGNGSL